MEAARVRSLPEEFSASIQHHGKFEYGWRRIPRKVAARATDDDDDDDDDDYMYILQCKINDLNSKIKSLDQATKEILKPNN